MSGKPLNPRTFVPISNEIQVAWFLVYQAASRLQVPPARIAFRVALALNTSKEKPFSMGRDLEALYFVFTKLRTKGAAVLPKYAAIDKAKYKGALDYEYMCRIIRAIQGAPDEWIEAATTLTRDSLPPLPVQEGDLPVTDELPMVEFIRRIKLVPRAVIRRTLRELVRHKGTAPVVTEDHWMALTKNAPVLPRLPKSMNLTSVYNQHVNPSTRQLLSSQDTSATFPLYWQGEEPEEQEEAASTEALPDKCLDQAPVGEAHARATPEEQAPPKKVPEQSKGNKASQEPAPERVAPTNPVKKETSTKKESDTKQQKGHRKTKGESKDKKRSVPRKKRGIKNTKQTTVSPDQAASI